ncbi:hypothetical protein IAU59_001245 [Kwoniella sp. CBS 9459]
MSNRFRRATSQFTSRFRPSTGSGFGSNTPTAATGYTLPDLSSVARWVPNRNHDSYEEILHGTDSHPMPAWRYSPFRRGGASSKLLLEIDTLAERIAERGRWKTQDRPMTQEEVRSSIMSGPSSCTRAPQPTQTNEAEWLESLHKACAENKKDDALHSARTMSEAQYPTYTHIVGCKEMYGSSCKDKPFLTHLSSLFLEDRATDQPGCINTNYNTPGHPHEATTFCYDPSHRPNELIRNLVAYRDLYALTKDPRCIGGMDDSMQKLEAHYLQHHPRPPDYDER